MTKKAQVESLPEGFSIGGLLSYYSEGWRTGYLSSINGTLVKIQPIGGYKSTTPNLLKVKLDDIKAIERPVAQRSEQFTHNESVSGSSPDGPTKRKVKRK